MNSIIEEINIEYDIKGEISLYDITQALAGINNYYRRKVREATGIKNPPELIVSEMSKASPFRAKFYAAPIIATQLLLWGGKYVTLHEAFDFVCKDLAGIVSGKSTEKHSDSEYDDLDRIVRPVYKNDEGSKFILFGNDNSENVIQVGWEDANIAHSQILQKKKNQDLQDGSDIQKEVLLYIDTAVNKNAEDVGDKGYIDSIDKKQLKLYFPESKPEIKAKVLSNPFKQAYIVTVDVLKMKNKPVAYKILELHDTISRE